jgi:hypothetical protein
MSTNGHVVAATWRAEDFADLEAYNGVIAVDVFDGKKPPIQLDARSYDQLVFEGATGNPLVSAALDAFYDGRRRFEAAEAAGQTTDIAEQSARAWDLQDKILAAIIKTPPYAPKAKLVEGRPPAGHLWYGSFTGDQRRKLVDFFYSGAEALKSFRPQQRPDAHAARPGDGVPPTAEPDSNTTRTVIPEVVAGWGGADLAQPAGRSGTGDAESRDIG